MQKLQAMLTYCRPHESAGEREFVDRFIKPYQPEAFTNPQGNVLAYVVGVGDHPNTPVLWSCHVDTVHKPDAPVTQTIVYDAECGMAYKDDKIMPLGADDGAGVWLMLEMIDAGVPGTYIFHRGEERGGIGSTGMAQHHEDFLRQFKWAIAFDRRGTGDIITDQFTGTTASTTFAQALADKLNANAKHFAYAPSPHGIFTDTANYASIIPECTNVSVGYDNEHTPSETLDVWHLVALRDALIEVFKHGVDLPAVRDPAVWDSWSYKAPSFEARQYEGLGDAPMTAEDIINLKFSRLKRYVRAASADDLTDLIYSLAEEVVYSQHIEEQRDEWEPAKWQVY